MGGGSDCVVWFRGGFESNASTSGSSKAGSLEWADESDKWTEWSSSSEEESVVVAGADFRRGVFPFGVCLGFAFGWGGLVVLDGRGGLKAGRLLFDAGFDEGGIVDGGGGV